MKTFDSSELPLKLYNIFPYRHYMDTSERMGIDDMIDYLPQISAMGFNAVWINPMHLSGNKTQIHPGLSIPVSSSLYAMADSKQFNPLIFPEMCSSTIASKLIQFTTRAKELGLVPLFDLVLNHIGRNEEEKSPLETELGENLLDTKTNSRWPDIITLNYYRPETKKIGIQARYTNLDLTKIEAIFSKLWTPFITQYIKDFGFMGARIDAMIHLPVYVQNRAYQLIQTLVQTHHHQKAIIVAELMSGQFSQFETALSLCQFTHCLNPYSFFWGPKNEGGYETETNKSSLISSTKELRQIFSPPILNLKLELIKQNFDENKHQSEQTIYINYNNPETEIVISYSKFLPAFSISLEDEPAQIKLQNMLQHYKASLDYSSKQHLKTEIHQLLSQNTYLNQQLQNLHPEPEIMAFLGNHDVGTLYAKNLLDLIYAKCLENTFTQFEQESLKTNYDKLKQIFIKSSRNLDELKTHISCLFQLSAESIDEFCKDTKSSLQEKIFLQAVLFRHYYILAGDEFSVLRKPDVFFEYGLEIQASPPSPLISLKHSDADLSPFFRQINQLISQITLKPIEQKFSKINITLETQAHQLSVIGYFCKNNLSYQILIYSPSTIEIKHLPKISRAFIQQNQIKLPQQYPVETQLLTSECQILKDRFYYQNPQKMLYFFKEYELYSKTLKNKHKKPN